MAKTVFFWLRTTIFEFDVDPSHILNLDFDPSQILKFDFDPWKISDKKLEGVRNHFRKWKRFIGRLLDNN